MTISTKEGNIEITCANNDCTTKFPPPTRWNPGPPTSLVDEALTGISHALINEKNVQTLRNMDIESFVTIYGSHTVTEAIKDIATNSLNFDASTIIKIAESYQLFTDNAAHTHYEIDNAIQCITFGICDNKKAAEEERLFQLCVSKFENDPLNFFATASGTCGLTSIKLVATLTITKMAKEEETEKLVAILETIWPEKHLNYHDIVTSINQGETQDMEKCIGPVKSHPRICSFLMHQDFEFRPVPNPKKQDTISFKEFLQKNNECLKSKDSFGLCKENFCKLSDCSGKILPDYEDFHDEL